MTKLKIACRNTLVRAYNDFVTSSPLQERVFKVLKDAVAPANVGFVALSDIADPDEAPDMSVSRQDKVSHPRSNPRKTAIS